MATFNQVVLVGNLTKDVELRNTPRGAVVGNMSLAVNRTWFDKQSNSKKEECSFFDVVMFGKTAEIAAEYLAKGRPVLIAGYLKQERWEDKQSGAQRSKVVVVCDTMQMLGSRDGGGSGGSREPQWKNTGEESQDVPERKTADYFPPDEQDVPF